MVNNTGKFLKGDTSLYSLGTYTFIKLYMVQTESKESSKPHKPVLEERKTAQWKYYKTTTKAVFLTGLHVRSEKISHSTL